MLQRHPTQRISQRAFYRTLGAHSDLGGIDSEASALGPNPEPRKRHNGLGDRVLRQSQKDASSVGEQRAGKSNGDFKIGSDAIEGRGGIGQLVRGCEGVGQGLEAGGIRWHGGRVG